MFPRHVLWPIRSTLPPGVPVETASHPPPGNTPLAYSKHPNLFQYQNAVVDYNLHCIALAVVVPKDSDYSHRQKTDRVLFSLRYNYLETPQKWPGAVSVCPVTAIPAPGVQAVILGRPRRPASVHVRDRRRPAVHSRALLYVCPAARIRHEGQHPARRHAAGHQRRLLREWSVGDTEGRRPPGGLPLLETRWWWWLEHSLKAGISTMVALPEATQVMHFKM